VIELAKELGEGFFYQFATVSAYSLELVPPTAIFDAGMFMNMPTAFPQLWTGVGRPGEHCTFVLVSCLTIECSGLQRTLLAPLLALLLFAGC